MGEHAIDVKNISIHYRILNSASVRGGFWGKKKRNLVHEAVKDLSFSVDRGEVLGIVGKNGSGKSTLLRSIAGIFAPNVGEIDLHGYTVSLMALGIGFVSRLSGRENIMLSGMLLGFSEKAIRKRWMRSSNSRSWENLSTGRWRHIPAVCIQSWHLRSRLCWRQISCLWMRC